MAAAQLLYLTSTASTVVSANASVAQMSLTPGAAATTGTSIANGTTLATWPYIPGTASNAITRVPTATAASVGWIFDGTVPGSYATGVWSIDIATQNTSATGAAVDQFEMFLVTATTTGVTKVSLPITTRTSQAYTPTLAATVHTTSSVSVTTFSVAANQYIYVEVYFKTNTAGTSGTAVQTLILDAPSAGANSHLTTPVFTPSISNTLTSVTMSTASSFSESIARSLLVNISENDYLSFAIAPSLGFISLLLPSGPGLPTETMSAKALAPTHTLANVTQTDAMSFNETISRVAIFALRSTSDGGFAYADAMVRLTVTNRSQLDAITYADTLSRGPNSTVRSTSDTLSFADTLLRSFTINRTQADAMSFSETIARASIYTRLAADTATFADTIARAATSAARSGSDTITFTDSVTPGHRVFITLADAFSFAEQLNRAAQSFTLLANDTQVFTDLASANRRMTRSASDSFGFNDLIVRATQSSLRNEIDAISFIDAITRSSKGNVSNADIASYADSIARTNAILRNNADVLSFVDAPVRSAMQRRAINEALSTYSETTLIGKFILKLLTLSMSDASTFADSLVFVLGRGILIEPQIVNRVQTSSFTVTTASVFATSPSSNDTSKQG